VFCGADTLISNPPRLSNRRGAFAHAVGFKFRGVRLGGRFTFRPVFRSARSVKMALRRSDGEPSYGSRFPGIGDIFPDLGDTCTVVA
jgi:hypothetical protein